MPRIPEDPQVKALRKKVKLLGQAEAHWGTRLLIAAKQQYNARTKLNTAVRELDALLDMLEETERAARLLRQLPRQRPQGTSGNPPLDLPPDPEEIEGGM
jgi:hypothetical protein